MWGDVGSSSSSSSCATCASSSAEPNPSPNPNPNPNPNPDPNLRLELRRASRRGGAARSGRATPWPLGRTQARAQLRLRRARSRHLGPVLRVGIGLRVRVEVRVRVGWGLPASPPPHLLVRQHSPISPLHLPYISPTSPATSSSASTRVASSSACRASEELQRIAAAPTVLGLTLRVKGRVGVGVRVRVGWLGLQIGHVGQGAIRLRAGQPQLRLERRDPRQQLGLTATLRAALRAARCRALHLLPQLGLRRRNLLVRQHLNSVDLRLARGQLRGWGVRTRPGLRLQPRVRDGGGVRFG